MFQGPDDRPKWIWQILMLLRAQCLEGITDGSRKCPVLPADAQPQQTKEPAEWRRDDAKAASITACMLSKSVAELVLTCTSAKTFGTSCVHGLSAAVCSSLIC